MPRKPIKPDRVRIPRQWWRALVIMIGICVVVPPVLVFGQLTNATSTRFWPSPLVSVFVFWSIYFCSVWYCAIVHTAWVKRILKHDGLLCPRCAYPLIGIQEKHISVTCPECGYLTKDTYQLFERWRKSMKSFFWQDDKRLRNRKYRGPEA